MRDKLSALFITLVAIFFVIFFAYPDLDIYGAMFPVNFFFKLLFHIFKSRNSICFFFCHCGINFVVLINLLNYPDIMSKTSPFSFRTINRMSSTSFNFVLVCCYNTFLTPFHHHIGKTVCSNSQFVLHTEPSEYDHTKQAARKVKYRK